jgi:hypothetical protein
MTLFLEKNTLVVLRIRSCCCYLEAGADLRSTLRPERAEYLRDSREFVKGRVWLSGWRVELGGIRLKRRAISKKEMGGEGYDGKKETKNTDPCGCVLERWRKCCRSEGKRKM